MAHLTGAVLAAPLAQTQIPWEEAAKVWGPLGIIFLAAIVGAAFFVRWHKTFVEASMADARRERDMARELLARQADQFLASLEKRDDAMEKGFDEVLHEIRNNNSTRRR